MSYRVYFAPAAEPCLARVPPPYQGRVRAAVLGLGAVPRPPGVVKLRGSTDRWRVRVGPYRIVYSIDDASRTVLVVAIGHRSDVYR